MKEKENLEHLKARLNRVAEEVNEMASMSNTDHNLDWLDNEDACLYLKVSIRTLQNLRSSGKIAYSMVSNKVYYRRIDLINFLNNNLCQKTEKMMK